MKNIYFDICAGAIFLILVFTFNRRNLNKYRMFSMFYMISLTSLFCVAADILMEYTVNPLPLSRTAVFLGTIFSFVYKFLRNATLVIYLVFIFSVTRTDYRIRSGKMRGILWAPNCLTILLLVTNFKTGWVFTVTSEGGYARGDLLWVLYVVSALYAFAGIGYLILCKRYLDTEKFFALLFVYILTIAAVLIQMVRPELMVEMFATAIGMLITMMFVIRPEERIDTTLGVQTWKTFQGDLFNTILSRQKIMLMVIQADHGEEKREFFGDAVYYAYVREIISCVEQYCKSTGVHYEIYCEAPANIYLIIDENVLPREPEQMAAGCLEYLHQRMKQGSEEEMWFHPHICVIRCPEDLQEYSEIINMCHRFTAMSSEEIVCASRIVGTRDFEIQNHMENILHRAIEHDGLEMYYQPIYSIAEGRFRSAEALARINDSVYGMISPAVFIPAAERTGMIELLGMAVIESVFRFMSEHDLKKAGISFIEINLSVAQCVQPQLVQRIQELQERYGIDPSCVNFEITETMIESIDRVMSDNLNRLLEMGYTLSLDDYGMGFSNVGRVRKLPLRLIKIDKSLVDDMFTEEGSVIIRNTVEMMRGINKQVVMEGVEDREVLDALIAMNCDYIQGFYFSRPLPENTFLEYVMAHNNVQAAGGI